MRLITLTLTVRIFFLGFMAFCYSVAGTSQGSVFEATRLSSVIVIDGEVTDEEWAMIPTLHVTQKVPNAGDDPTQETELRIAYDENYLYMSGRMYDDEPEKIVANTKKRDDFTENTEWCGLLIDSYNDRENALAFYVTPTGAKLDMALSNDAQGPTAFNLSWNNYWDVATTRDERGWFAELRIPFTSLPFEIIDGYTIMGITAWRYLARNDETDIFPARDLSTGSSFRPSLTQRFAFTGIQQKKPVHITPYVLAGMANVSMFSTENNNRLDYTNYKKEIGLDAKITLGSNATMDVTVNTDFAQVEADDQQVNLARTNIFFPEKRLFFQERSSLFDFNFGSFDKLFHSRRIGIVNGQQARIYGGIRAIGKFGSWESGILTMQTADQSNTNAENFTVLRLRKKVLNDNSTIGLIYTNRADFQGAYNSVYGVDANLRIVGENYLGLRWAQSFSDGLTNELTSLDGSKFYLECSKRSQRGLTYNINYGRAGKDYNPAIGFEHRYDFSKLNTSIAYNLFPEKTSAIVQHGPYTNLDMTWSNGTGALQSQYMNLGYNVLTKSGYTYNLQFQFEKERLLSDWYFLNEANISSGDYNFQSVIASISSSFARKLAYSVLASVGSFYDGHRTSITLAPFYNITPDFILEGSFEINHISLPDVEHVIDLQLLRVKALYTFSTQLSLNAFVQRNSLSKEVMTGIRLRYNPSEGNDFYFVYNGGLNEDMVRPFDHMTKQNTHTLFLKYSHTFHL